jgi:hypothetical protein
MSFGVYIAFAAWFLLTLALFLALPAPKAVVAALVLGVLFLPVTGFPVTGLRSKLSILSVGVGMTALVVAPGTLLRFRPRLVDLPVAVWCAWPVESSLANGLGLYDGLSALLDNVIGFGVPYLLGRAYCASAHGLREVATGIFMGGVAYIPFCLFEIRFSPQLHTYFYGFHQHEFVQTFRSGGWRPVVFMDHGLMVAMWMTAASLLGFWLWRTRSLRTTLGVPVGVLVGALSCTAILSKSAGALILLAVGLIVTFLSRRFATRLPVALLLAVSPAYLALRVAGPWTEDPVLEFARDASGEERTQSLQFRFRNEKLLLARALEKPFTGWGRWGRFLVPDPETAKSLTVPDSLWIIALGQYGVVGLTAITTILLLPVLLFLVRFRPSEWNTPQLAPTAALALLLALYMIDNLLNAMINPVYFLCAGGLTGLCSSPEVKRRSLVQAPAAGSDGRRQVPGRRFAFSACPTVSAPAQMQ